MSLYTKTGDNGTTGLIGGIRVEKDSKVIQVLGSIDELNAFLGIIINELQNNNYSQILDILNIVQKNLFELGAEIANLKKTNNNPSYTTKFLEKNIDQLTLKTDKLSNFILPGGSSIGAKLHYARTICRRAERNLVTLHNTNSINLTNELKYLNRLSDLLFILARYMNKVENYPETIWKK